MDKQIDNPVEHALTKQESIKLMKVMNSNSVSPQRQYEIIKLSIVRIAGVAVLLMQTKSTSKGFTTNRTGDKTFYPVLHWSITLSDDRGFAFTLDQCTKTEYVTEDGEFIDNWM